MDKIDSLKFFIRCVEKKGIASAGRDFGMSAATASSRLTDLENYYGAKLLNRTTRSISLTEEGRVLLDRARHLVDESDNLRNQIRLGSSQLSGLIKLSAPHDLGRNVINPILDAFIELHPDIKLEFVLEDNYMDLIEQGIDLAVRLGQTQDSSLISRKLASNRRVICASPSYWETNGMPQHPNELRQHDCLIMHWGKVINQEWKFSLNKEIINVSVSGKRASNCGDHVKTWCLAGRGIAFKSLWDIKSHLESGALVEALADYTKEQDSALQLLFPGGYPPARRVRALIDFMIEHFKNA